MDLRAFSPENRRAHEAKFGGFNSKPPNLRRCTSTEFWHHFAIWGTGELEELRQIFHKNRSALTLRMFHHDGDQGYAIAVRRVYKPTARDTTYFPVFYKFAACLHTFEGLPSPSSTLHRSRCTKCGYVNEVDSSG